MGDLGFQYSIEIDNLRHTIYFGNYMLNGKGLLLALRDGIDRLAGMIIGHFYDIMNHQQSDIFSNKLVIITI
jgi:hypothetical protein